MTAPEIRGRDMLTGRNLKPGRDEIRAGDRLLGTVTERQLHEGLNIASMTADPWEPGGPWDAQAGVVKELTEARDRLTMGNLLRSNFLPDHPERNTLDRRYAEADGRWVALQRDMARPFPYRFEIRMQPSPSPIPWGTPPCARCATGLRGMPPAHGA